MRFSGLRIKEGYILRELGGEFCIVSEDDSHNGAVNGLPSLNETGIFLWNRLEQGDNQNQLVSSLMKHSGLDYDDAVEDVGEFLAKLINGKVVTYQLSKSINSSGGKYK